MNVMKQNSRYSGSIPAEGTKKPCYICVMEIWFIAAVMGAVFAGLSNFYFKIAASRNYDAELFSLYGGVISIVVIGSLMIFYPSPLFVAGGLFIALTTAGGFLIATNNIYKIFALRHIDATIYYPLYKILSPALAIVIGISLFQETFSFVEWSGLLISLAVPVLLITKTENGRQNNLVAGLLLVLLTGVFSAGSAALYKLAIDAGMTTIVVLFYASIGLFIGSLFTVWFKTGWRKLKLRIITETNPGLIFGAGMRAVLISASFGFMLYAFAHGGTLAIVQTIHSLYILIPIILAIIFYNEHWNLQKAIAIVLSVSALALLS